MFQFLQNILRYKIKFKPCTYIIIKAMKKRNYQRKYPPKQGSLVKLKKKKLSKSPKNTLKNIKDDTLKYRKGKKENTYIQNEITKFPL